MFKIYQENKERLKKKNVTKVFQKVKRKSLLSIEKIL